MHEIIVVGIAFFYLSLFLQWGPGTHLDFAQRLLSRKKHRIPQKTHALITQHEEEFLYGNIAADIINFKSFGGPKHDCHKWDVIRRMRSLAKTDGENAFILGYLSHLAADTIAHNHFVPYHLARYATAKATGHLYWEMAADRYVPEGHWKRIDSLKKNRDLDQNDQLINAAVTKKLFSLRTNKLLFNHLTLSHSRDNWRNALANLKKRDEPRLPESRLDKFRRAALERMVLALQDDGVERISHYDPSGKHAQSECMRAKRALYTRFLSKLEFQEHVKELANQYLKGMS